MKITLFFFLLNNSVLSFSFSRVLKKKIQKKVEADIHGANTSRCMYAKNLQQHDIFRGHSPHAMDRNFRFWCGNFAFSSNYSNLSILTSCVTIRRLRSRNQKCCGFKTSFIILYTKEKYFSKFIAYAETLCCIIKLACQVSPLWATTKF